MMTTAASTIRGTYFRSSACAAGRVAGCGRSLGLAACGRAGGFHEACSRTRQPCRLPSSATRRCRHHRLCSHLLLNPQARPASRAPPPAHLVVQVLGLDRKLLGVLRQHVGHLSHLCGGRRQAPGAVRERRGEHPSPQQHQACRRGGTSSCQAQGPGACTPPGPPRPALPLTV